MHITCDVIVLFNLVRKSEYAVRFSERHSIDEFTDKCINCCMDIYVYIKV